MRTNFAKQIALVAIFWSLFTVACPPTRNGDSDMRPVGPDVKADLLIYFKAGVTTTQINAFSKEVLSRPGPNGRGDSLPPGVRTFLRLSPVEGHDGIAITFFPSATKEQREELKRAVEPSPVVHKVLENLAPTNVKKIN